MNGTSQSSIVNFNTVSDLGWKVTGKGSFLSSPCETNQYAVCKEKNIFWRKKSSGETYIYTMRGAEFRYGKFGSQASPEYEVAGVGDLNGDGWDDIVWRSASTGQNYVWLQRTRWDYMTGCCGNPPMPYNFSHYTDVAYINTVSDLGWQIHAVADFNGDGKADIFWRKPSTNETYVYLMNGSSIASGAGMQPVSSARYVVAGAGDLNGDGKEDIVWRDQTNGENYVWFMNGTASPSVQLINTVADQAWKIEEIGDYNGDGKADLFWRKSTTTGENWIYLMNGSSITSSTSVAPTVHIDYKVVP